MAALRRWWHLPRSEKRLALALAWRLPLVDLGLRTAGLKRTRRWLLRGIAPPHAEPSSRDALADAQRLAALAAAVGGRGGTRTNCLRQALVVEQWLRRRGLPAELQIGVRKNSALHDRSNPRAGDNGFDAHAWIELDGVALGQPTLLHTAVPHVAERVV